MKKITTMVAAMSLMAFCTGRAQAGEPTSASQSEEGKRVLVAYFSCTGTTERVAETIAAETKGVLYRITPKQPYTSADLNWNDEKSRSSVEMKDLKSRPELADKKANIAAYDVIFVGYPIWWYTNPTIVNTFFEAYDFSGKTVIPFATSGGSSITKSEESLKQLYKGIHWKPGKRLTNNKKEITDWVQALLR